MPMYILNRNFVLRSLLGHSVEFVKGEPCYVPPMVEKEAIAIGAVNADGDNGDVFLEPPPPPPLSLDARQEEMVAAFELLVERNDANDFTAQGIPTVRAVEKIVSFTPTKTEIVEAYNAYRIAKGEAEA